jgi:hypothetical protein
MQEAKIDKAGVLILIRKKEEVRAHCNIGGVSNARSWRKKIFQSRLLCCHDCPGWEEHTVYEQEASDFEERRVHLCEAMGKTYKIVSDERGE